MRLNTRLTQVFWTFVLTFNADKLIKFDETLKSYSLDLVLVII